MSDTESGDEIYVSIGRDGVHLGHDSSRVSGESG